jgi:hypothetical protein
MAAITSYATLLTEIADELNRTDLTSRLPGFVQRGESRLSRDKRARLPVDLTGLEIASEEEAAPADLVAPDVIAHDGGVYFGELDLVGLGDLTAIKRRRGDVGVPVAYAIRSDGAGNLFFVFAPEPSETFTMQASYYAGLTNGNALGTSNQTNRFLLAHPDIYFYAALVESAPFLREDERIGVWEGMLQQRLEDLRIMTQEQQTGGTLSDAPRRAF